MAPLLFLAAAIAAAIGSVDASPALWALALGLLAILAWRQPERLTPGITPIAVAVWAYALWVVASNLLISPAYTAAAPFHAAFLAGGFALGRGLDAATRGSACAALAAGATVLALWALAQVAGGAESRGHAHFETPATLATVLNLALVPALAALARGPRRTLAVALAAALAAGLFATLSRGGTLALACGLLVAFLFAGRLRLAAQPGTIWLLAAALALGWILAGLAPQVAQWLAAGSGASAPAHDVLGTARASAAARVELYALAASALDGNAGLGIGYLGFNALLEAGRQAVPSYGPDGVTYFAHNDYLQTLVELGLPGLAAFLAMIGLPFWLAWRRRRDGVSEPLVLIAVLASLATMAAHAVVDFPFYVPLCLLLFGLLLGTADRLLAPQRALAPRWRATAARLAGILVAAGIAVLLARPVAAEVAAGYAQRSWRTADAQAAAYWFEVARRLEPRDWRYHWYAGQFWLAQAAQEGKPAAAQLAEAAFAAGFAANARQPQNLLGRISAHRRFGALLAARADARTLRGWMDQALALAPLDARVHAEQALLRKHLQ